MKRILIVFVTVLCMGFGAAPLMAELHPGLAIGLELDTDSGGAPYLQTSLHFPFWGIFHFSMNMLTPTTFDAVYIEFDGGAGAMVPLGSFSAFGEFTYMFLTHPGYTDTFPQDSIVRAGVNYKLADWVSVFGHVKSYLNIFGTKVQGGSPKLNLVFGARFVL
ncbi:MAG TPA: hypothetical protein VMZ05_02285 [Spirochaetota bacterium]|nr:hypothetical protein [Spirochaetota bacterium]